MKIPSKSFTEFRNYLNLLQSENHITKVEYYSALGINHPESEKLTASTIADYDEVLDNKASMASTNVPETAWYTDWKTEISSTILSDKPITLSSVKYAKFVAWLDKEVDDNIITDGIMYGALGIDNSSMEENKKQLADICYSIESKQIPNTHIYQYYLNPNET
jgi:hypothetical protein